MNTTLLNQQIMTDREFERLQTLSFGTSAEASIVIAQEIADLIRDKASKGENAVLGLATGSSPLKVYDELIRLHKEEGLSFKNVITFNLDEYYPMQPDSVHSYVRFMKENLFDHVDIDEKNIHIPDGTVAMENVYSFCQDYEAKIAAAGGLDIQVLGIGRTGHIGFNEPGSTENSRTRIVTLDAVTRIDAAPSFGGLDNVPKRAITMGVKPIMQAGRIIMMAWGSGKAPIVKKMVEGDISMQVPATFLQKHDNVSVYLDEGATENLTRITTPWLVREVEWTEAMIKKAVVWLAYKTGKPVLKLTNKDYLESGLDSVLSTKGSAYDLNIEVFNMLQHTISGWPGGKPNADDTQRPERAEPAKKRVIIFSPHPDDDVISMGGTFQRLVDQGHEVHVAYQTSGNIAVSDDDARRYATFTQSMMKTFGFDSAESRSKLKEITGFLDAKEEGDIDSLAVRQMKGQIRRDESIAACRYTGIPVENVHFLDLPFYETGKVRKNPVGTADIEIIKNLLTELKPEQIYAAGDLADPHGTHRVCLDAIFAALEELKTEEYMKNCWCWLYRGAWHEWPIDEIEMAVPMSPEQVLKKRKAIFFHESQKDGVVFQGTDDREFWQRAEERNAGTAKLYNKLGLAEYEAMEAFVRYHFI
ncbi:glucosamine-6-phosphate deaminase [Flammeovirga kamogawensis]|uniref:Glucosamine-6-phosphate deaminase n=1 Tax=Flammeovirga kamogawensis TaxID=373891 RepID=A0ABX8GTD9_9BACT|nr:glucosamine-6-phosphate deaminase [Flammeovirga kamogawensis]MBB6463350.1 glucosamine-6-phosphate deaminase [Flammeovirga kamogawensis]QWG06678.1 glucosamine-6-phosphate deaminase [Flammeovirga kamogawensis]TRX68500.1 glucosamine-6-phosphate deaminase [Flammeovirga kamogawensis]